MSFIFTLKNLSESVINDSYSRLFQDDFYVNIYYFMWTNLWYIPFFISFLFINLTTYRYYSFVNKYFAVYLFFILLLLLHTLGYYHSNTTVFLTTTRPNNINSLLLNSLNKYHPFLLYLSAIFFSITLLNIISSFSISLHKSSILYIKTNIRVRCLLGLNLFSLFLGG